MLPKRVQKALARLRKGCPSRLPVRVRVLGGLPDQHWGHTIKGAKSFTVCLRRSSVPIMVETLVHEWAHVLSWRDNARRDHDINRFGREYARAYRVGYDDPS